MALSLTRRPGQGFRLYCDGVLLGTLKVRYGLKAGEIKCVFDCDQRLQVQREELPPRELAPPPHHAVREEFDDYLDDAEDFDADRRAAARNQVARDGGETARH